MKLFNLMGSELVFLKDGLELNAPLSKNYDVVGCGCQHCEIVCASGCGANCSGGCGGQGRP